jgi:hypothetical protein
MSSEQPEVETAPAVTDITQQATTPTPKKHVKNPKRVEAGKMVAERTRKAREAQKKAAAEASAIIANNKAKAAAADPEPDPPAEKNSGLSVNQWISIGGLAVSAAGLYLKREEIMAAFKKNLPEPPAPASVEPEPVPAPRPRGIRNMD